MLGRVCPAPVKVKNLILNSQEPTHTGKRYVENMRVGAKSFLITSVWGAHSHS